MMIALFLSDDNISGMLDINDSKTPEYYFKNQNIDCIQKNTLKIYFDKHSTQNINTKISILCGSEIKGLAIIHDETKNLTSTDLYNILTLSK